MNTFLLVLLFTIAPALGPATVATVATAPQRPCPSALSGDVGDAYHDTYRATPLALGPTWLCRRPS